MTECARHAAVVFTRHIGLETQVECANIVSIPVGKQLVTCDIVKLQNVVAFLKQCWITYECYGDLSPGIEAGPLPCADPS